MARVLTTWVTIYSGRYFFFLASATSKSPHHVQRDKTPQHVGDVYLMQPHSFPARASRLPAYLALYRAAGLTHWHANGSHYLPRCKTAPTYTRTGSRRNTQWPALATAPQTGRRLLPLPTHWFHIIPRPASMYLSLNAPFWADLCLPLRAPDSRRNTLGGWLDRCYSADVSVEGLVHRIG